MFNPDSNSIEGDIHILRYKAGYEQLLHLEPWLMGKCGAVNGDAMT